MFCKDLMVRSELQDLVNARVHRLKWLNSLWVLSSSTCNEVSWWSSLLLTTYFQNEIWFEVKRRDLQSWRIVVVPTCRASSWTMFQSGARVIYLLVQGCWGTWMIKRTSSGGFSRRNLGELIPVWLLSFFMRLWGRWFLKTSFCFQGSDWTTYLMCQRDMWKSLMYSWNWIQCFTSCWSARNRAEAFV